MEFFIDTAEIKEIRDLASSGMVDGVTTNPSLIAKSGRDFVEVIREICEIITGPVSAEVLASTHEGMLKEAKKLADIAGNVTVKLPLTWDGLKTCKILSDEGIMTNVTLCFTPAQALLAAKAGATYISPFVGRLDDIGQDGMQLISDIATIFRNYNFKTKILVASVRHPTHLLQAALIGADVATIPPAVLRQLINHPLTDKGLAQFLADSQKSGQKV